MTTTTRLTLDEFLAQPEQKPYREYAYGEAWEKPMPDGAHARIQLLLGMLLLTYLQRSHGGDVFPELRCIFGPAGDERTFVPDLTVVTRERLPSGDARTWRFLRTAPDLAIEILSPEQSAGRFADKLQFYLGNGVRLVWVVDPASETVTVYALGARSRLLRAGDTLDGGDVLPGFAADVAGIFARLRA
jgi:Uma2 family endonuclease